MQNAIPVVGDRIRIFILRIVKVAKFHNKGSDKICQTLKKLNLVFSMEFTFTCGI